MLQNQRFSDIPREVQKDTLERNGFLNSLSTFQSSSVFIWDALRSLVPLWQFKKREKQPWMSVTFSKVNFIYDILQKLLRNIIVVG